MAELTTLARPYAQAIYRLAREQNKLSEWSQTLADLLAVIHQEPVARLIGHAKVDKQQLCGVIDEICAGQVSRQGRNLVALLIENNRLELLPEIAAVYEMLRAEAEGTVEAEVVTAFPLDPEQEKKMAAALKKRLGKEVRLKTRVDRSILGGAVIRAGDMVIDGSTSGKLSKLGYVMNS